MGQPRLSLLFLAGALIPAATASAGFVVNFDDGSGLSAVAEFQQLNATTLEIRLQNTSTSAPVGADSADVILTGLSWDFGGPGQTVGDPEITGGTVVIGPSSMSLNFDTGAYGPGTDVSGEWGYGNMDGTGALENFISANAAQATVFGGANLDGPISIDGPQGGLAANPLVMSLGGLGAIQDEIIATVTINQAFDLDDLGSEFRVEFGSDYHFINVVPAPPALALLGTGLLLAGRRRRG